LKKLKQQNSKEKERKGQSEKNELIRMAIPRSLREPRDSMETRKLNAG